MTPRYKHLVCLAHAIKSKQKEPKDIPADIRFDVMKIARQKSPAELQHLVAPRERMHYASNAREGLRHVKSV